ncbi:DUF4252 domain-containing protein [Carboxylicivirga sp. N1Y90]|uniref:DUF4252 domain-containing protein n=1 Tax=Carboxylicivirga fragile TaxID=3417571 RepID=UPI003D34A6F6|nr:DUF4252 domain-containing protein [Marinilabiliaceae bacterium N1Y90]
MKQLSILLIALSFSLTAMAQNRPSDRLFEKMALKPGVTMMSFSKAMLDAVDLSFDDDEDGTEGKVTGDLNEVKVVIYTASKDAEPMDFRGEALRYLPLSKFKDIDADDHDIDNDSGTVDIRVLKSGRKVKECHMLFQGETNGVLLSFFGDFKVEQLKEMAEKMDNYK